MDHIWNEIHKSGSWGAYPSEHVIRFVARNYYKANRSEIKILDFGCGGGAHTWYLAREGFDTYAFDGAEAAAEGTKEKLKKEGLNANVSVQDGTNIKYDSDFFDAVIDNVCIYANMLSDIKIMYDNVYRVLKEGGKLLTVCFSDNTYGYGLGEKLEENTYTNLTGGPLKDRGIVHFFSKEEIIEVLTQAGLKNIFVDMNMHTDNGKVVEHYVVQAEK